MARYLFTLLIIIAPSMLHAQFFMGTDASLDRSVTFCQYPVSNNTHSDITYAPGFSINLLSARSGRINYGISSYFEKYSVVYGETNHTAIIDSVSDKHKSSFIFIAPVLDYRIDANSNWHLFLRPSLGIETSGNDKWTGSGSDNGYLSSATGTANTQSTSPSAYTNQYNTVNNNNTNHFVNRTVVRIGLQLQRRISLSGRDLLVTNIGYSLMPGSLTSIFRSHGYDINLSPQVFSLGIGYMREFNKKPKPAN